jgi:hypothetical protein
MTGWLQRMAQRCSKAAFATSSDVRELECRPLLVKRGDSIVFCGRARIEVRPGACGNMAVCVLSPLDAVPGLAKASTKHEFGRDRGDFLVGMKFGGFAEDGLYYLWLINGAATHAMEKQVTDLWLGVDDEEVPPENAADYEQ